MIELQLRLDTVRLKSSKKPLSARRTILIRESGYQLHIAHAKDVLQLMLQNENLPRGYHLGYWACWYQGIMTVFGF